MSNNFPDSCYLITAVDLVSRLTDFTLIDLRPAEDFAVGHIPGSIHVDIYGVSLNDSSEAPFNSFLAIFRVLSGSRRLSPPVTLLPLAVR
ncbi:MAG: rhodanese-like domain-containing protein [Burkholderiales bacterium]|nr:rhodanese-like domain-containing protein [Burkholderiales bacterium]